MHLSAALTTRLKGGGHGDHGVFLELHDEQPRIARVEVALQHLFKRRNCAVVPNQ